MKSVTVTMYYSSGMSTEYFSDLIMIDKPYDMMERTYEIGKDINEKTTVGELIQLFKTNFDCTSDEYMEEILTVERAYIYTDCMLLGLLYDKSILQISKELANEDIDVVFFYVGGGASAEYQGFKFIVHPREEIHRNKPHVHVKKGENETRYSLETFERFPEDKCSREFLKKEKSVIIPYLKNHIDELMNLWNLYLNALVLYITLRDICSGVFFYYICGKISNILFIIKNKHIMQ